MDPDDNKFVECAVEGRARYILSRNNDMWQTYYTPTSVDE
nr:PIN domain-containing protein [Anaerolineae bacterium]